MQGLQVGGQAHRRKPFIRHHVVIKNLFQALPLMQWKPKWLLNPVHVLCAVCCVAGAVLCCAVTLIIIIIIIIIISFAFRSTLLPHPLLSDPLCFRIPFASDPLHFQIPFAFRSALLSDPIYFRSTLLSVPLDVQIRCMIKLYDSET